MNDQKARVLDSTIVDKIEISNFNKPKNK